MATISDRLGHFDGQIGPVVFTKGTGQTDDPDMLAYFAADGDRWDVTDKPTPKELLQARAHALGLDTAGTKAELLARITAHDH